MSPFKSEGASVHLTTDSRGVRISGSNAGYTMFRGSVKGYWLPTPFASFPFTSPTRASPCAITFQLDFTTSFHCFHKRGRLYTYSHPVGLLNSLSLQGYEIHHAQTIFEEGAYTPDKRTRREYYTAVRP